MKLHHVLSALAATGLVFTTAACGGDDHESRDAYDENRSMQYDARGEPLGEGNVAAYPVPPGHGARPASDAVPAATSTTGVAATDGANAGPAVPEAVAPAAICEGLVEPESCPLQAGTVQRTENIEDGVTLHLRADQTITADQLERRVECFATRAPQPAADEACPFALPGVDATVSEEAGRVQVRLVTTDATQVQPLRERARALARRGGVASL